MTTAPPVAPPLRSALTLTTVWNGSENVGTPHAKTEYAYDDPLTKGNVLQDGGGIRPSLWHLREVTQVCFSKMIQVVGS